MILTTYDKDLYEKTLKEDAKEEGREEGLTKGRAETRAELNQLRSLWKRLRVTHHIQTSLKINQHRI